MVLDYLANTTEHSGIDEKVIMNLNYAKLKYKHSFLIPENIKVIEDVTYKWYGDHGEYAMYQVETIIEEQLKNIVPAKYQKYFAVNLAILSNDIIYPHCDEGKVTINFYIQTANATTSFYRVKDPLQPEKFFRDTKARLWDHDEVDYVNSFTAKVGEIWVLDTQVPHGVKCESKENRIAYTLRTDYLTFADAMHILNDGIINDDTAPSEDMPG